MRALALILILAVAVLTCDPCYNPSQNQNCKADTEGKGSYTLHMTVHPHLDAFWIFNFDSYYDPKPSQGDVRSYFAQNRFSSVKDIFTTAKNVLWESKNIRQTESNRTQKAHRMFVNSQMGFFKRWYREQSHSEKQKVKELLKTKYWEILGGGYVEHDEGCAYYDDIIQNFELGLHFLKKEFDYYPKVAVSADSFGHSQSTLAILAHLGIEGFFVERSDQHILLQNKTEFVWRAKSANGQYYGALPTHIRWAIHGFQDQFLGGNINQNMCQNKQSYMRNLRSQNEFLKRILKSPHIMRYFGHDFQKFDNYSYTVMEHMMKKFSMEKCNRVTAVYGNPTQYFITLMGEVFGQGVKPVATRSEDIMPIWDYDSGLYWTGYYTTDAYHKKDYRDLGRLLHGTRKIFMNIYANQPDSERNKKYYKTLEKVAEQVSYLQHHDGISGTSKYTVMDELEMENEQLRGEMERGVLRTVFQEQFPIGTNSPLFECHMGATCKIPKDSSGDVYLKIINTDGNPQRDPLVIELPIGQHYQPNCQYELNCFCFQEVCPCKLYLYKLMFTFTTIRLKKVEKNAAELNKMKVFVSNDNYRHTETHFVISLNGKSYELGYKRVTAKGTPRNYKHLSRYGTGYDRGFNIRPGKYALGNDPNQIQDFSSIKSVAQLESKKMLFFLVEWKRYKMKTLITISKAKPNEWKVETITATQSYYLSDLYFEVITKIDNKKKFVVDSNGWLTIQRELFKHEDYQAFFSKQKYDDLDGNSYPCTAFAYLQDGEDKVSVNVERPQGVTAYRAGTLWFNIDRLSEDDGKWVYENAYRSQYQKYTHVVTVQNYDNNERRVQRLYDQPLFVQGNSLSPSQRVESTEVDVDKRNKWNSISNIDEIKFSLRPFDDNTTILRVQNLNDSNSATVGLFAGQISPFLTTYYARSVTFAKITEAALGGNMPYSKFIADKWNWKKVINLGQQNLVFDKLFKENITLRPLQIRTFILTNMRFADDCKDTKDLVYNNQGISFKLDTEKEGPKRDPLALKIEEEIINFNQNGDRCAGDSPVLKGGWIDGGGAKKQERREPVFKPERVDPTTVEVKNPVKETQYNPPFTPSTPTTPSTTQTTSVPTSPPAQSLSMAQIYERILSRKLLTPSQKQFYFSTKFSQMKQMQAKTS